MNVYFLVLIFIIVNIEVFPSILTFVFRYLKSVFMDGASATDILDSFREGLKPLKLDKILQISMDGPNVNWKFLRLLNENEDVKLLQLGSCGLHVLHGAFQTGHKAAQWSINEFLRGIYWLFKDSPARRTCYKELTGQAEFPLKFCSVRWVENASAAYRALGILEHINKYISDERTKLPATTTVKNVKHSLKDKLLKPKLAFFAVIASNLEVFLTKYQSRNPLVPFLYKDMDMLFRSLLERFVKKDFINTRTSNLLKLNFEDNNIYLGYSQIDLGFRTKKFLTECKVTEGEKTQFLKDCRCFLKALVKKLVERSPLRYPIVKAASCLDPEVLCNEISAKEKFNQMLEILSNNNVISIEVAESASTQFNCFFNEKNKFKDYYEAYKCNTMRLDEFFSKIFVDKAAYKHLYEIIKMIMILSHGNATVESGFSINKQMLVENQMERSLVARRQVYDEILNAGGTLNIDITNKLKSSCKNAHFRYNQFLEEQKRVNEEDTKKREKRRLVMAEINLLEKKRAKINDVASYESKNIDLRINNLRHMI